MNARMTSGPRRSITVIAVLALLTVLAGSAGMVANAATTTVLVGQANGGTTSSSQYNAAAISNAVGDTVTWNSFNTNQHNVVAYSEAVAGTPDWDSGIMRVGGTATFSRLLSAVGVTTYYCSLHANRSDAAPGVIDASIASGIMVGKITTAAAAADVTAPTVTAVAATPNPTNGAASVTLTATVTDSGTPISNIAAAEYSVGASAAAAGSGTAMAPSDGAFSSSTENVTGTVSVGTLTGTVLLWVRGKDAANLWSTAVSTSLSITVTPSGSVPASVTLTGGSLSNSTTPVAFGALGLTGADATLNVTTAAWRAIDARGTGTGWNVSIASTDFTSTAGSIAVANFKVRVPATSILRIAGNAVPTSGATTYQPLGSTALKLLTAAVGAGMGTYDYLPDFQLTVPASTLAGAYTATVIVSVNSGP